MASKCYDSPPSSPEMNIPSLNNQLLPVDAIRILGIHKKAGEPLVSRPVTAVLGLNCSAAQAAPHTVWEPPMLILSISLAFIEIHSRRSVSHVAYET